MDCATVAMMTLLIAAPAGAVEYRFYHPDPLGSNSVVTDRTGTVVQRTVHRPFGQVQSRVDGQGNAVGDRADSPRHLFTGQEHDAESDLDQFGARYYDPLRGGFLSQDPVWVGGRFDEALRATANTPQIANGYGYSLNRPTAIVDPTGELPHLLALLGYAALVGLEALDGISIIQSGATAINDPSEENIAAFGLELGTPLIPIAMVRRATKLPNPKGGAKVVDAAGNPRELGEGAFIEFPAAEAHLANSPKVTPARDIVGFPSEDRFVMLGPKGEVVIGEGRNRAVAAAIDGATIPPALGGVPGRPGVLRYPIGDRNPFHPFNGTIDADSIVQPSIGQGGYVRYRKAADGSFQPLPPKVKP